MNLPGKPVWSAMMNRTIKAILLLLFCCLCLSGCAHRPHFTTPRHSPTHVVPLEVTGYCDCQICCGWKRSWWRFGKPVIASGPNKGQPKAVGVTASGTKAQRGTLAADTRYFPMGTIMYIPGYGWGRVEDRGGAIKGNKLDLFFDSHEEALEWGRKQVNVQVWMK